MVQLSLSRSYFYTSPAENLSFSFRNLLWAWRQLNNFSWGDLISFLILRVGSASTQFDSALCPRTAVHGAPEVPLFLTEVEWNSTSGQAANQDKNHEANQDLTFGVEVQFRKRTLEVSPTSTEKHSQDQAPPCAIEDLHCVKFSCSYLQRFSNCDAVNVGKILTVCFSYFSSGPIHVWTFSNEHWRWDSANCQKTAKNMKLPFKMKLKTWNEFCTWQLLHQNLYGFFCRIIVDVLKRKVNLVYLWLFWSRKWWHSFHGIFFLVQFEHKISGI